MGAGRQREGEGEREGNRVSLLFGGGGGGGCEREREERTRDERSRRRRPAPRIFFGAAGREPLLSSPASLFSSQPLSFLPATRSRIEIKCSLQRGGERPRRAQGAYRRSFETETKTCGSDRPSRNVSRGADDFDVDGCRWCICGFRSFLLASAERASNASSSRKEGRAP